MNRRKQLKTGVIHQGFFCSALVVLFILTGCKTFEPEKTIHPPVEIPKAYRGEAAAVSDEKRLPLFTEHTELKGLIARALSDNFDLNILKADLAAARAVLKKQRAASGSTLGFSAGGKKQESQSKTNYGTGTSTSSSHAWDASLSAAYTVDVWGKLRARETADRLDFHTASLDVDHAIVELQTSIAQIWIDIISVRNQQTLLKKQIENNQAVLELLKFRFLKGKATALDVSQQVENLARSTAGMPLLKKQEQVLFSALVFLSGKADATGVNIQTRTLPTAIVLPNTGLPMDLLENRIDIKAARMGLESSKWLAAAARADRMPSFALTAQALFSSGRLDLLFQNWVATLAATVSGSLFDSGLKKAEVERLESVVQKKVQLYAKTIAKAIQEVEDTLVGIKSQAEYIDLLEQEREALLLVLKDARLQYLNGQSSYLNYLTARNGIDTLDRQLIGERAEYLKQRIDLHRVLGIGLEQ